VVKGEAMRPDRDPRTFAIIGAAMEVHRRLGHGFLEAVYQEALELEFAHRNIPARKQVELPITYRGSLLRTFYKADFLCYESVIVEVKAVSALESAHHAQVINYLKATGHPVGMLLNFGSPSLGHHRLIFTGPNAASSSSRSDPIASALGSSV
jgi:GxxExxY protein